MSFLCKSWVSYAHLNIALAKKSVRVFSLRSYGKTQTVFLTSPIYCYLNLPVSVAAVIGHPDTHLGPKYLLHPLLGVLAADGSQLHPCWGIWLKGAASLKVKLLPRGSPHPRTSQWWRYKGSTPLPQSGTILKGCLSSRAQHFPPPHPSSMATLVTVLPSVPAPASCSQISISASVSMEPNLRHDKP